MLRKAARDVSLGWCPGIASRGGERPLVMASPGVLFCFPSALRLARGQRLSMDVESAPIGSRLSSSTGKADCFPGP